MGLHYSKLSWPWLSRGSSWVGYFLCSVAANNFPGGQKRTTPSEMIAKDGASVVRHAIKGMLPKNKLGAAILRNCYIYADSEHKQEAQKPISLSFNNK